MEQSAEWYDLKTHALVRKAYIKSGLRKGRFLKVVMSKKKKKTVSFEIPFSFFFILLMKNIISHRTL